MAVSMVMFFILTLAILVVVHEYGHYWVARRCGVRVLTFSVGFGPTLWQRVDGNGTQWNVAALPLGGYVKMLDEREAPVPDSEKRFSFNNQSLLKRAAIVSAGPIANFLLAIVVYAIVNMLGVPGYTAMVGDVQTDSPAYHAGLERGQKIIAIDGKPTPTEYRVHMQLVSRIGETGTIVFDLQYPDDGNIYSLEIPIERWLAGEDKPDFYGALGLSRYYPNSPTIIETVTDGGPAALAGIQSGDKILSIDDISAPNWRTTIPLINARAGQSASIEIERDGQRLYYPLTVRSAEQDDGSIRGLLDVRPLLVAMPAELKVNERYGPIEAIHRAVVNTGEMIAFTFSSIQKMLVGLISTSSLSGPVTIAKIASATANSGFVPYMEFLALLSVSLGVLNLLPIPVLDGGHLLFIAAEAITRRPVPERLQIWGQQLGLLLILSIMVLALYNDITHF